MSWNSLLNEIKLIQKELKLLKREETFLNGDITLFQADEIFDGDEFNFKRI